MLRFVENIDISFRYQYTESYCIGRLTIDFSTHRHAQFLPRCMECRVADAV